VVEYDGAILGLLIEAHALEERDAHDDRKVGEAITRFLSATAKGLS
jgi:hypothetical protein